MIDLVPVAVLGASAGGLASIVRALPGIPREWLTKKPIGCNACLSTWSSIAVYFFACAAGLHNFPLLGGGAQLVQCAVEVLASAAIGGYLLAAVNPPPFEFDADPKGEVGSGDGIK